MVSGKWLSEVNFTWLKSQNPQTFFALRSYILFVVPIELLFQMLINIIFINAMWTTRMVTVMMG